MSRKYAIIFVCQGGKSGLEAKACLLAASLHRFAKIEHELIAAIPGPANRWPAPSPSALAFLKKLGVRTVSVENKLDLTYAIANKIGCLSVQTSADKLVLLDSDMFLMRQWRDENRFEIPFNARPAAAASFTSDDRDWSAVYAACRTPSLRGMVRTIYSGELVAPYFNSAFIAVPAQSGFGDVWLDCCRRIDAAEGIPNTRPYLDQIALSPAISRLGLAYDCLEDSYNYPINFKPIAPAKLPLICHYHDTLTLLREPDAVATVQSLLADYRDLAPILKSDPAWEVLVSRPRSRNWLIRPSSSSQVQRNRPELIITGIPRSGTSYLCNLLHRLNNCVVLNEPEEIGPALENPMPPWPVATFFRDRRRDILVGVPIKNKLVNGEVVEDTARANEQISYSPKVTGPNFVLGVKTTIPFLSRLTALRRVMPGARFVACVRNPLDTIASWKTSFPHLRDADINLTRIGNPRDPWLSGVQRMELSRIASLPDVAVRRAAWWRYLASLVLESKEHLIIIRYEDLVAAPLLVGSHIVAGWKPGKPKPGSILPSQPRSKRQELDRDDIQAIHAICSDLARELGYF